MIKSTSVLLAIGCLGAGGCRAEEHIVLERGVSRALARERASQIKDPEYDIFFSIPEDRTALLEGVIHATFRLEHQGPIVFDFAQSSSSVHDVRLDGVAVSYDVRDEHILIRSADAGPHVVSITFTPGEGSLNRQDDFLYTLFVPDRARVAFPVFDQPDLKARYRLKLDIPATWQAVSNTTVIERTHLDERVSLAFAETEPISSYLFSFVVGHFQSIKRERGGRTLTFYHRETDELGVARNIDAIFDLHSEALSWMEAYTAIDYPFEKFDFVAIPAFQYGGMEHPGAILYRADSLFLEADATQDSQLRRASLIAHETAHQWFGDLVTMDWFSDVWMKETFANFMAAKIINPAFPKVDHELRFLHAHHAAAYEVDRTRGANPIRQELDNLAEAGTLYGAIIYQKAPIVIRQLERLVGELTLQQGLREYLNRYAFDNAGWLDLIEILDERTDEDLVRWSQVWVEGAGRPVLTVEFDTSTGSMSSLVVKQEDIDRSGRVWNQWVDVIVGQDAATRRTISVQLKSTKTPVVEATGLGVPRYVLVNGRGYGYGRVMPGPRTQAYLLEHVASIDDPLVRAVAWMSLWEALLENDVPAEDLLDLILHSIPLEDNQLNLSRLLDDLTTLYWRFLPSNTRGEIVEQIENLLWSQLRTATDSSRTRLYFQTYRKIATTEIGVQRLLDVWRGQHTFTQLDLSSRDYTQLAQELAMRSDSDGEDILLEQRTRIENPDRLAEFDFSLPALSSDQSVRDLFVESLADVQNRARESWVLDGLGFIHHPLRARTSERHIEAGLDLLEEVQRTGDIFFPERWVSTILAGHQTSSAAEVVTRFLEENQTLSPRLRGKVLQAFDGLERAALISQAVN